MGPWGGGALEGAGLRGGLVVMILGSGRRGAGGDPGTLSARPAPEGANL